MKQIGAVARPRPAGDIMNVPILVHSRPQCSVSRNVRRHLCMGNIRRAYIQETMLPKNHGTPQIFQGLNGPPKESNRTDFGNGRRIARAICHNKDLLERHTELTTIFQLINFP